MKVVEFANEIMSNGLIDIGKMQSAPYYIIRILYHYIITLLLIFNFITESKRRFFLSFFLLFLQSSSNSVPNESNSAVGVGMFVPSVG